MSHGHFVEYCTECKKVISQCRCMSNDKTVKYSICKECQKKEKKVCNHKFDCDGCPCTRCGKTWIEIQQDDEV